MTRKLFHLILPVVVGFAIGGWWVGTGPATQESTEHAHDTMVYRCPMHPTIVTDVAGSCPICAMDLVADKQDSPPATREREISHWRAPMDATYTSDGPGTSPMGMALIPVYADELGAGNTVTIDPTTMQNMGVRTAVIDRRTLIRPLRVVGRIVYDETRMSDVNTKVSGWVEKLHVDFTGQRVELGQPLLEIYSPELVNAQEEHLIALDYLHRLQRQRVNDDVLQGARELVEASSQRLQFLDVSPAQIERLEREEVVSRTVMIESPQQGIVVHKDVFEGGHIRPGEHLYRIADVSSVWVYADLFERDLPWVKEGQSALVSLSAMPDRVFRGTVAHLFPFLDTETRSLRARMIFDNADGQLKPGMYADVVIHGTQVPDVVAAPVQAILHTGSRRIAIVHLGDGTFQPRPVSIGVEADGWYEIRDGLRAGDEIVTSAQFLIDSESNLKTAVSNMRSDAVDLPATAVGG